VAHRVQDAEILHLLTLMLKASGKREVPQGGVISPPSSATSISFRRCWSGQRRPRATARPRT
jgi:hypothetical protein